MHDTRLIHAISDTRSAKEDLAAALRTVQNLLDDGPRDVHDAIALQRAEKLLSTARAVAVEAQQALRDAATPMVCNTFLAAGQCGLPLGHNDSHAVTR